MREIKNYKGFRKKPLIYGMNTLGFFVFLTISIISLLSFLGGFSLRKIIVVGIVIGLSYLVAVALSSNESIINFLFDDKLPKNHSDDE
jgi:hypothetical protein